MTAKPTMNPSVSVVDIAAADNYGNQLFDNDVEHGARGEPRLDPGLPNARPPPDRGVGVVPGGNLPDHGRLLTGSAGTDGSPGMHAQTVTRPP